MRLLLLPGLNGTSDLFAPLLSALGDHITATTISYPLTPPLDYAALTQHVRAQLPAQEPFVILAESFSGPIGIAIAATQPANLRGLILVCTFARFPQRTLALLNPLTGLIPFNKIPQAVIRYFMLGKLATIELDRQLRQVLQTLSNPLLQKRLYEVMRIDQRALLPHLQGLPVCYFTASQDRLISPKALAEIRARLPTLDEVVFDGPHMLLQTRPRETAAAIQRFIQQTEAPPTA